jgi:sarcosine oxidase
MQLLHPTPQLTFGLGADLVFAALESAGAPVERITDAAIRERFPAFGGRGDAVLETTSAVIAADRTLAALRAHAGADVREGVRVERLDARHVETASEVIEARAVVVCAGPWSRALVPAMETTTTLEHVAYVRTPGGLPIFIDFTAPTVYGLPTPGSELYKLAVHHGGPEIDPNGAFTQDPSAATALRSSVAHWLPEGEVERIDVCPYDNTADETFVIERIDGIVVGAGTSGHAFKFGPLLGEHIARLVLDAG